MSIETEARSAARIAYMKARDGGKSKRASHSAAMRAAERALGRVEGAWDIASQVQDAVDAVFGDSTCPGCGLLVSNPVHRGWGPCV
jgi:hypothetical protein